jgi:D-3-phosphoglycerate dehydrogenase
MENVVFDGAEAAIARIHLDQSPSTEVLDKIRTGNNDIIELNLIKF